MGVSINATNTLNNQPIKSNVPNLSQPIAPAEQRINKTIEVSTNCENIVEALFLNHKCLPLVSLFQK